MKKLRFLILILFTTLFFQSCQKQNFNEIDNVKNENRIFPTKKLQNPYSVANMRKAYENIYGKDKSSDIQTTHYYIKFKPKNEDDLTLLEKDTILELYDYPLDYEPYKGKDSFHDPRVPDNQPTYLYAAVDVNHTIPNVDYEIIEDLYIPELDEQLKENENKIDKLVYEALKITNNLTDEELIQNKSWWPSKWRPAGRILVHDDIGASGNMISYLNLNNSHNIPVEKAKVRARRWFTTYIGYTNEKGYFSCNGRFRRPANYSIVWETNKFDIRNGTFGQAYYNGPKKKGNWYLTITGGKSLRYATIFRAACRYYFWNIGGLLRPMNYPFYGKIKISYYHRSSHGGQLGDSQCYLDNGILSNIRIFGQFNNGHWLETYRIYSTTIHEMAHTNHARRIGNIQFWQVSNILVESWARAIQWYITKIEYNWLGNSSFDDPTHNSYYNNMQHNWLLSNLSDTDKIYTPLFIDLVDNFNQRNHFNYSDYPDDRINQYTMHNLEIILYNSYGLTSLKQNLKQHKPYGVTNTAIDNQLSCYFNL